MAGGNGLTGSPGGGDIEALSMRIQVTVSEQRWGAERALIGDEAKGLGEQELRAQVLKKVSIICRNIRSE